MATSVTPPPLQGPTAKEKKYDRQLRLWAASGQMALEESHILLLNEGAGTVGVETLKNLVLPGVGNFTIVDDRLVEEKDLGVNFFLAEESLGRSRAEECCRYLQELNPEVRSNAIHQNISTFISTIDNIRKYTLILITAPTSLSTVKKVASYAWDASIPLLYIHSNGFYSQFSLQLPPEFPIVDTHPDPVSTQDLRLLNPWPELLDFMHTKSNNIKELSDHEHGHIPYLLVLLYFLDEWKAQNNGRYPENYKEKSAFRSMVGDGARKDNAEGGEENFDEAIGAVLKSLNPPSISSGLREVFEAEHCQNPTSESPNFWIIANALQAFHKAHKVLPLPGALPDMKAQSVDYIQLQNIYKSKARQDLADVTQRVRELEQKVNKSTVVDEKEIEAFCKGAAFVKLIKGSPLRIPDDPQLMDWSGRATYVLQELENEESLVTVYLALLAFDDYYERNPAALSVGELSNEAKEAEQRKLKWSMTQYTDKVIEELKKSSKVEVDTEAAQERLSNVIMELARGGLAELHNISALTGGMVAQEVIKVLTKQYVPIDNTCVFDGISSKTAVLRV
ncbi:hypothetical protein MMC34_002659 [Xylographa carneopallida]|nr:hypothetical protein [Xylographa carneopallida]